MGERAKAPVWPTLMPESTPQPVLLVDFDSTIVKVESLDLLALVALGEAADNSTRAAEIAEITRQGMDVEIDFRTSLERRLCLLEAGRSHVTEAVEHLLRAVTPSFASHRKQLAELKAHIKNVDPDAFVIVNDTYDVVGRGFKSYQIT